MSSANAKIGIEGGLYGEYFHCNTPYNWGNSIFSGGAVAYIQLGKYVTLNYRLGFSKSGSIGYVHCPASWGLAGYVRQNHGNGIGLLFCVIPEGIGFYTKKDHFGLHVGLDILGLDYFHVIKNWSDVSSVAPSFNFRYRFSKESKLNMLSPYAGIILPNSFKFFSFKLGLAITFESKKSTEKEIKFENESSLEKKRIFHTN